MDDLNASVNIGKHALDQRELFGDRSSIGENQSAITAGAVSDSVSGAASSLNRDEVISQTLKLALDAAAARIAQWRQHK